jgi:hypothetical protein
MANLASTLKGIYLVTPIHRLGINSISRLAKEHRHNRTDGIRRVRDLERQAELRRD